MVRVSLTLAALLQQAFFGSGFVLSSSKLSSTCQLQKLSSPTQLAAPSHSSLLGLNGVRRGAFMDDLDDDDDDNDSKDSKKKASSGPAKIKLEPEVTVFDGPPSWTECVAPAVSIITVIGLVPFAASIARQIWVRYKVTTRRISVTSGIGGKDVAEVIYPDIKFIKFIYRSFGTTGDMVINLRDGAKLEIRSVPDFEKNYRFILSKLSPDAYEASDKPTGTLEPGQEVNVQKLIEAQNEE